MRARWSGRIIDGASLRTARGSSRSPHARRARPREDPILPRARPCRPFPSRQAPFGWERAAERAHRLRAARLEDNQTKLPKLGFGPCAVRAIPSP